MVDVDTNKETILIRKKNSKDEDSRCFFIDWFRFKNYEIQLRLDNNNDPTIEPVLDADIRYFDTKEPLRKEKWHHTEKKYDQQLNKAIYDFKELEGLHLRLYQIYTKIMTITSDATVIESSKKS